MRDLLAERAAVTPERLAVVDATSGEHLTYGTLSTTVDDLARHLAGLDVGAGDRIGLLADTSTPAATLVHAGWRVGASVVLLNPRLAVPELERQWDATTPDVVISDPEHVELATNAVDGPIRHLGETDGVDSVDALTDAPTRSFPAGEWSFRDVPLIAFTSGTTGSPSSVSLTLGNLVASAVGSAFRLGTLPTDRWLVALPIHHVGGLSPLLRSTLYGSAVVIEPGFDAERIADSITTNGATGLSVVPTGLHRLLAADAPLDALRFVLVGGAPTPRSLIERALQRDVPIYPTYGLTEAASQVATATPNDVADHPETVGRPLIGTEVHIVDDQGDHCPVGTVGEIVVDGPTVSPDWTASDGLHTDDLGVLDDAGRLTVVGRQDDAIITGGETVHPGEVARVIRDHPSVADVGVVGLDDPEWGQRVAAGIVPADPQAFDMASLEVHCRGELADFERPKTVRVVNALPRTASGTIDRAALREMLA